MTERLLQFIWQFQYFNKNNLHTLCGEVLQIIYAGQFNTNQGPDFLSAKVRIGDTLLVGNIELHLEEGDWYKHSHSHDPNYRNIILHVLWESPPQTQLSLPTIALKEKVPKVLLQRYLELMHSRSFVPCANSLHLVTELTWKGWKERLLAERLIRKSMVAERYLFESNQHWEEVLWWMLARNFGIQVNADAFESIARSLSLTILARHRNHVYQLEALLLGQAGLLDQDFSDPYPQMLRDEYKFFQIKYGIEPVREQVHFLRMRPGNFPTLRLAQLAMLLHSTPFLFSQLKEAESVQRLYRLLKVTASDYWDHHYILGEEAPCRKKTLGNQMVETIIINAVIPLLFAYGHLRQEQQYKDKVLQWMEQLMPEKNAITSGWTALGMENRNAWDSQALLELKKSYCDARRCLECAAGNSLLKPNQLPAGTVAGQLNTTFTAMSG